MVTLSTLCGSALGVTFLEVRSLRGVSFVLFNTHLCFTDPAQHAVQVIDTLAGRYPGRHVGTGIDWILTTDETGQAIDVTDASVVVNASQASDHIPITATLVLARDPGDHREDGNLARLAPDRPGQQNSLLRDPRKRNTPDWRDLRLTDLITWRDFRIRRKRARRFEGRRKCVGAPSLDRAGRDAHGVRLCGPRCHLAGRGVPSGEPPPIDGPDPFAAPAGENFQSGCLRPTLSRLRLTRCRGLPSLCLHRSSMTSATPRRDRALPQHCLKMTRESPQRPNGRGQASRKAGPERDAASCSGMRRTAADVTRSGYGAGNSPSGGPVTIIYAVAGSGCSGDMKCRLARKQPSTAGTAV